MEYGRIKVVTTADQLIIKLIGGQQNVNCFMFVHSPDVWITQYKDYSGLHLGTLSRKKSSGVLRMYCIDSQVLAFMSNSRQRPALTLHKLCHFQTETVNSRLKMTQLTSDHYKPHSCSLVLL